jgi:hypothetical protein
VCRGYPPIDLEDGATSKRLIDWLQTLAASDTNWGSRAAGFRKPSLGQTPSFLAVRSIRDPQALSLKQLSKRGIVVGYVTPDPDGINDRRYELGSENIKGYRRGLFLVIDSFRPTKPNGRESYDIGSWAIMGVTSGPNPKLRAIRRGRLHFCTESHDTQDTTITARLNGCTLAHRAMARESALGVFTALGGQSLLSAVLAGSYRVDVDKARDQRLFFDLLNDSYDAPIWLQCGTGCCTFEPEGTQRKAAPK